MQVNHRRVRAHLGTRVARRSGSKQGRYPRPKTRMKGLLAEIRAGKRDDHGNPIFPD